MTNSSLGDYGHLVKGNSTKLLVSPGLALCTKMLCVPASIWQMATALQGTLDVGAELADINRSTINQYNCSPCCEHDTSRGFWGHLAGRTWFCIFLQLSKPCQVCEMRSYFDTSLPEDCSVASNASIQGNDAVRSHTAADWHVLCPNKEPKVITNITASPSPSPSDTSSSCFLRLVSFFWIPRSPNKLSHPPMKVTMRKIIPQWYRRNHCAVLGSTYPHA